MLDSKTIKDLIVLPSDEIIEEVFEYSKFIIDDKNYKEAVFYWNIYTGDLKVNLISNQINFKSVKERLKTMTFTGQNKLLDSKSFYNGNMLSPKTSVKKDIYKVIDAMKSKVFEMEINKSFNYDDLLIYYNDLSKAAFEDINPVSNWPYYFKEIFLEEFLKNE